MEWWLEVSWGAAIHAWSERPITDRCTESTCPGTFDRTVRLPASRWGG